MPSPESTPFGQYRIQEKIAQGGMAEIFKGTATDQSGIEKTVVIKRILPNISSNPEFVEMLLSEAKIAVQLTHGNIARTFDLGKMGEDYFIVMEYVDGKTLSQIMRRLRSEGQHMPLSFAVYIASEIASGLDYIHRKTDESGQPLYIVHRDISPQNIIVSRAGNLKIIDFGIAKARIRSQATEAGVLKGKFAYMSPEHAEGETLDPRSDLFSLGIILHELLTGHRLFRGKDNTETVRNVLKCKVKPPSSLRPEVPENLDNIVLKMLKRKPADRYLTAYALQQDLVKFLVQFDSTFTPAKLAEWMQGASKPAPKSEEEPEEKTHEGTQGLDEAEIQAQLDDWEDLFSEEKEEEKEPAAPSPPEEKSPHFKFQKPLLKFSQQRVLKKALPLFGAAFFLICLVFLFRAGYRSFEKAPQEPVLVEPLVEVTPAPAPSAPPQKTVQPTTHLKISSNPPGAAIFLNDRETGLTTPTSLSDLKAGETYTIGLYLKNYKFLKESLRAGEIKEWITSLELNQAAVQIQTLPEGASVLINGTNLGTSPLTLSEIPPDTNLTLTLSLSGYKTWSQEIKTLAGKTEVLNITLEKEK